MEASTSGASCNQKDWQEKQKAKYDTWSQCRTMTPLWGVLDQGQFQKRALFK